LNHLQSLRLEKAKPISRRLRGYKVLVAKGYFEPPQTSKVQLFIRELNALGLNTQAFPVNTTDSVEKNAQLISEMLEQEITQGHKLIVAGASKGSAELYGALALLNQRRPELFQQGKRGGIAAVLSISGTLRGSFLVDWAIGLLPYQLVRLVMVMEAKETGVNLTEVMPGLGSQSTEYLKEFFAKKAAYLPQSLPFFDVVGAPNIEAVYKPGFVSELRESLLDTGWFPRHTASDGMVSFPNMVTPDSWARENYQIVMNANHPILDGDYHGNSMEEQESRRLVLEAFFQAIADRIEAKF
jgi:hypothetical protein